MIAVIKKSFIAIATVLLLVISGLVEMQVAEVVDANPVPWQSTPNQDKPTITIETPQNNTNDNSVNLNFTVTKPDSWKMYMHVAPYVGQIGFPKAYLDGNEISIYSMDAYYPQESIKSYNYSAALNQSSSGLHMLNVTVLSYTYYRGPAYHNTHILSDIKSSDGPVYEYPIVVSDIVYFTVGQQLTPSPTPTIGLLTSTPTPIEVGGNDSIILSNSELIIAVIVVVGICMIVGLLLKRRL